MTIEKYLSDYTGLIDKSTGKVYDAKYTHEYLNSLAKRPLSLLSKAQKNRLIKLGYADPIEPYEYKFPYLSPTSLAENECMAIRCNKFYNSMGNLGSLLIISRTEMYVFGYVSGCFYPYWYKVN